MGPREEKKAPYNPPNDKPTASCFGPPAIVGRLLTLGWSLLASQQFNSQTDCWSKADEHCYSSTSGVRFCYSTISHLPIVNWVFCTGFFQLYKRPSHSYTHTPHITNHNSRPPNWHPELTFLTRNPSIFEEKQPKFEWNGVHHFCWK